MPFSARKIRTRREFDEAAEWWSFSPLDMREPLLPFAVGKMVGGRSRPDCANPAVRPRDYPVGVMRETVAEHRQSALGVGFRRLVLEYVPMLGQDAVFDPHHVGCHPRRGLSVF